MVLFLSLLEAGLRITGYFYSLNRANSSLSVGDDSIIREKQVFPDLDLILPAERYTILCLGDSYTGGGNVYIDEAYPSNLQRLLVDEFSQKKYSVINGGVCEYNSKQVLVRLPGFIKKYKPDMVIFLVGSSDRFNFAGYNFHEGGIKSLFYNLRIYKMFKIIRLNLKAKILAWKTKKNIQLPIQKLAFFENNSDTLFGIDGFTSTQTREGIVGNYFDEEMGSIDSYSEDQSPIERAWYYYNKDEREEAIKICEEALKANPNSIEILCNLANFYYYAPKKDDLALPFPDYDQRKVQHAAVLYNKALEISPDSEFVLNHLAFFYFDIGETYLWHNKYDLAVEFLSKSIELDLSNYAPYYLLAEVFAYQSKYDADYIIQLFQKLLRNNPDLRENGLFINYFTFFKDREKWERKIDEQLQKNLKEIIKLCQRKNIKVIIQNYPYPYTTANSILKDTATKNFLPFVDNHSVFKKLVADGGWSEYFIDDEHCTPKGYQIMAENIYNKIIKKHIVD